MLLTTSKNWDDHVLQADEVSQSAGFLALRDQILALAAPRPTDRAVDIGAGTGLLALPLAEQVSHVCAVDISGAMGDFLLARAADAGVSNVDFALASAVSLPLPDGEADLVVSNYCFHHLDDAGKDSALREVYRVLRPGGRFVFGDMMFQVSIANVRDRRVIAEKVRALLKKGPAGVVRLLKNSARFASRNWETPARADWWRAAMQRAGFVEVSVEPLEHEGGIAVGRRPADSPSSP